MKTFDLNEAAAFLRLHPHTLEAKARAGEVPGAKPGKCWVFIDEDLADWLRAQYSLRGSDQANARPVAVRSNASRAAAELQKRLSERTAKKRTTAA